MLSSMQNIYEDFLQYFQLSKNRIVKSQGFTYKVASKINFRATTRINKSKQYLYALTILHHIKEERQLIYIDETGVGKDFIAPRVWCNKSQTFYIDRAEILTRINIIGAMSRYQLVFQFLKCNVNAQLVQNFLIKLIHIYNKKYGLRNYVFVLDNASVHKEGCLTKEVLKYVNNVYLPPYSPQLNPIEHVWCEMKNKLSKQDCRTGSKLNQEIHQCFSQVSDEHLNNYYQSVFSLILRCLKKKIYESDSIK